MPGRHYSDRPHKILTIKLDHSSRAPHSPLPQPSQSEPESTEYWSQMKPFQAQSFPCSLRALRLIQLPPSRGPLRPVLSAPTAGLVVVVVGMLVL